MKLKIQKSVLSPVEVFEDVRSVAVLDDFGAPLIVCQQYDERPGNTKVIVVRATDPDFEKMCEALGININAAYKVLNK